MKEILIKDIIIKDKFTEAELDDLLKPENYIGTAVSQVENLIGILKKRYRIEL